MRLHRCWSTSARCGLTKDFLKNSFSLLWSVVCEDSVFEEFDFFPALKFVLKRTYHSNKQLTNLKYI